MTEYRTDLDRYTAAARIVLDGRDPKSNLGPILVTLEGVICSILLVTMGSDAKRAAAMLHEGVSPRVDERLALYAIRKAGGAA